MRSKLSRNRFSLHQSTQRWLSQTLFCLLGLLPVALSLAYVLLASTPWYQNYQKQVWLSQLSSNLDLIFHVDHVEFPAPNCFRARGMRCIHPETGAEITRIDRVDGRHARIDGDRTGWMIELWNPQINGQQLDSAIQVVHDRIICRPQHSASVVGIQVKDTATIVNCKSDANNFVFDDIKIRLAPSISETAFELQFMVQGQSFRSPAVLHAHREHTKTPTTTWAFESQETFIPCEFLAARYKLFEDLGSQAAFRGKLNGIQSDESWTVEAQDATFFNVSWDSTLKKMGAPIHGSGDIKVIQADVRNGHIESSDILFYAEDLSVSRAWMDKVITYFELEYDPWINSTRDETLRFGKVGIRTRYQNGTMALIGTLPRSKKDSLSIAAETASGHTIHGQDKHPISLSRLAAWIQSLPWISNDGPRTASR